MDKVLDEFISLHAKKAKLQEEIDVIEYELLENREKMDAARLEELRTSFSPKLFEGNVHDLAFLCNYCGEYFQRDQVIHTYTNSEWDYWIYFCKSCNKEHNNN